MVPTEMSKVPFGGNKFYYIYAVKCSENGRVYVGRTRQPLYRKRSHINCLRKGNHPNEEMQKDFAVYGEKAFTFTVVDKVPQELKAGSGAEREWMKKYNSYDIRYGYNYKDPKFHPRRNHTKKVADFLGVPVEDLLKDENEKAQ